jgi:exopolysaccharide biosynthesis polyprenyl glycosylphosphotransferase
MDEQSVAGALSSDATDWVAGVDAPVAWSEVAESIKIRDWSTDRRQGTAWRRFGFLALTSLFAGVTGFLSLALAHRLVDRTVFACSYRPSVCAGAPSYFVLALAAGAVVCGLHYRSRPDRSRRNLGYVDEWAEAFREMSIAVVVLVFVGFFWRPVSPLSHFNFSRGTILLSWVIGIVLLGLYRTGVRLFLMSLRRNGRNLSPVVVVGNSYAAGNFIRRIDSEPATGYRIVAHISDAHAVDRLSELLRELRSKVHFEEVIIASQELVPSQVSGLAAEPALRDVQFRAIPELYGLAPGKVQMEAVADFPLLSLFYNPITGARWVLKRAIDVVGSVLLLLISAPVMSVTALAIRLTSSGPILFRQERVGMDGRRFEVLKFRTMYHGVTDAHHREFMHRMLSGESTPRPAHGFYKLADDPRMTSIGKVLRRFSVDELPQLINVLKGEMSLVGPRPALAYEVDLYEEWQRRRLDVLPGITGLWQVSGRSRLSPTDMLRLDVLYAETWSLSSDIRIILKTIMAVLRDDAR